MVSKLWLAPYIPWSIPFMTCSVKGVVVTKSSGSRNTEDFWPLFVISVEAEAGCSSSLLGSAVVAVVGSTSNLFFSATWDDSGAGSAWTHGDKAFNLFTIISSPFKNTLLWLLSINWNTSVLFMVSGLYTKSKLRYLSLLGHTLSVRLLSSLKRFSSNLFRWCSEI